MPKSRKSYPPEFREQLVALVRAGRTPADLAPGRPFDPPQRSTEASQRQDLLSFVFSQDVAHAGQERPGMDRLQKRGDYPSSRCSGIVRLTTSTPPTS